MAIYEPMNEEEIQSWVASNLRNAIDYVDDTLSVTRADAERFYLGKPFSESSQTPTEEKGRSAVVSRDVATAVSSIFPTLMRLFFSGDRVCEFAPRGVEDIEAAEQATTLANYFLENSNAYHVFSDAFQDMLIKGAGFVKVYYDRTYEVETRMLTGLDEMQLGLFVSEGFEVRESNQNEEGLFDVTLIRKTPNGQIKLDCIAPEEFLINRSAKSIDDAKIVAQRSLMRVGDLVELGYDLEEIQSEGYEAEFRSNSEWLLRNPDYLQDYDSDSDSSNRLVQYVESYCRMDQTGDGILRLYRICSLGDGYKILMNEPVDDIPFIILRMENQPHSWNGRSVYDNLADIQRIKSAVQRNILDSLSLSTRPRVLFNDQLLDWEKLSDDQVGALIPVRGNPNNAIQMLTLPFIGQQAFPLLSYLDQVAEERIGIGRASQGLELDHLQSTTAIGIAASQKAAQSRLELIARNVANSGFKPLYEKLLKLALTNMVAEPIMMRIKGKFVPVDVSTFSQFDVKVVLSVDTQQDKTIASLLAILQKQEQLINQYGPENPIVGVENYYATLNKLLQEQGLMDTGTYLRDPQSMQMLMQQQMQQLEQQRNEPPKPSPEEILANGEVERKILELEQKREEMVRRDDLRRDELESQIFLKIRELEQKFQTSIDARPLADALNRNRELERIDQMRQQQMYQQPQPQPMNQ